MRTMYFGWDLISINKTIKESDGWLSDFIDMYQSEE